MSSSIDRKIATIANRDTACKAITHLKGLFMERELDDALEPLPDDSTAKEQACWNKKDRMARGLIIQCLSPDDCDSIEELSAHEALSWIENKYISVRDQSAFVTALSTFTATRVYDTDTWAQISDKFSKIQKAASTVNNMKNTDIGHLGPVMIAGVLLNALPRSYDSLKQTYMERSLDEGSFSVNNIKQSVEALCTTRRSRNDHKDNSGRRENSSRRDGSRPTSSSTRSYGTCPECGKAHSLIDPCRASEYTKKLFKAGQKAKVENEKLAAKLAGLRTRRPTSSSSKKSSSSSDSLSIEVAYASLTDRKLAKGDIKLDSGAAGHITSSKDLLANLTPLDKPIALEQAASANQDQESRSYVTHTGTMYLTSPITDHVMTLSKVYWGKDVRNTLISISALAKDGYEFKFSDNKCQIFQDNALCAEANISNGLYNLDVIPSDKSKARPFASPAEAIVWHRRLGHVNWRTLVALAKQDQSMPLIRHPKVEPFCLPCQTAKQFKTPMASRRLTPSTTKLELIHTDLAGPFPKSIGGARYYISFTNDHSRYSVIYFMASKAESLSCFQRFKLDTELETGCRIKTIRSDNGGEFTSTTFDKFLSAHGIKSDYTAPNSPEFNGVAERLNRTLAEKTRAFLHTSGLPESFWAEAMRSAVQVRNLTTVNLLDKSPAESYTGSKQTLTHTRIFGCVATVLNQTAETKLSSKATPCMNLCYAGNGKYRLFDASSGKIRIASFRHIKFFEDKFLPESLTSQFSTLQSDVGMNTAEVQHFLPKEFGPVPPNAAQRKAAKQNRSALQANVAKLAPNALPADVDLLEYSALNDPQSYKAAHSSPDADKWTAAELVELENMKRLKVFKPCELPEGATAIPLKWVYKRKYVPDGDILYKARLTARGDRQSPDTYNETFAPVAKLATIRFIIAMAVHEGKVVKQWDFIAAYLQSCLREIIYCLLPQGYRGKGSLVWQALKALYGLRQSGNTWNGTMSSGLEKLGWTRLSSDHGVYRHKSGALLAIWVDDCVLAAHASEVKARFDELASIFELRDLGDINSCLGIDIKVTDGYATLVQSRYISSILKDFNMQDCSTRTTPLEPKSRLGIEDIQPPCPDDTEYCARFQYRKAIGKLMYLMVGTRPDIAHSVALLSRFCQNPNRKHIEAVKHVLRYISGTNRVGISYRRGSPEIIAYSDADWGGDSTKRSTTGYLYMLSHGPISWCSKLQKTVSISTTEAEYYALSECVKEGLWIQQLHEELRLVPKGPLCVQSASAIHLFGNNKGAIDLTAKTTSHGRTKHIDIRHHFLREKVQDKTLIVSYILTDKMLADCLTKPVSAAILERNTAGMGMIEVT